MKKINAKLEAIRLATPESLRVKLEDYSYKLELLYEYSEFLEANGYLDSDWRTEEPYPIDEFIKNYNK